MTSKDSVILLHVQLMSSSSVSSFSRDELTVRGMNVSRGPVRTVSVQCTYKTLHYVPTWCLHCLDALKLSVSGVVIKSSFLENYSLVSVMFFC